MTRFELANFLGNRLYMLDSEERHRIIDKHIATVNDAIISGVNEADAVAQLGDPEILVNVILARHHIDPVSAVPQEEKNAEETNDTHSAEAQKVEENTDSFKNRFLNKKSSKKTVKTSAATDNTVTENTEKADSAIKGMTEKSKGAFSRLFNFTADVTLGLVNLMIFCVLWIPCMLITLTVIVCTVAAITMYIFSGIGFMGVCIAGTGCCVVGASFTAWLGNILTGGKRKWEEC